MLASDWTTIGLIVGTPIGVLGALYWVGSLMQPPLPPPRPWRPPLPPTPQRPLLHTIPAPFTPPTRVIPKAVKSAVWARDGGQCVDCGTRRDLSFGHIIPWSKGGANTIENLQIECMPCNQGKGNRI